MEMYQDENGEWKMRFNPQKAVAGMALVGGIRATGGRTKIQKQLAEAIATGTNTPINFGKLSKKKFAELNKRLVASGQTPLQKNDLYVHPAVVTKLFEQRLIKDGMTADQVADIAYSAIHGKKSRILTTREPQIKAFVNPRENIGNTAFVGEFGQSGSIKSVYPKDLKKIQKESLGGRGNPPSGAVLNPAGPISDIQDSVNSIAQPTKGVEAGNIPLKSEATAKLSNLMNYPKRLAEMGYSAKEIEGISAPKAKQIIDKGLFASTTNQGRRISDLQSVSQAPASLRQTMDTPLQTQGQKELDSLYNPLDRRQPLQTQPQQRIKINSKQQLDQASEKIIQQAKTQIYTENPYKTTNQKIVRLDSCLSNIGNM